MKIYDCLLKSRKEMERDIPAHNLGWWHDCIPGQNVKLREATEKDLEGKWLRRTASTNPDDYMIELHNKGSLVLKKAIKSFKERQ